MATDKNDLLKTVESETKQVNGSTDKGIINTETGQAITLKENKSLNIIAGNYSQFKIDDETGTITQASLQSNNVAVQTAIITKDLSINRHKLNSQLYELTNFKKIKNGFVVGGISMGGYIYAKAWEPTLEKFVLIRRPIVTPVFSGILDAFKLEENLGIEVNIDEDIVKYKSNKDNKENK